MIYLHPVGLNRRSLQSLTSPCHHLAARDVTAYTPAHLCRFWGNSVYYIAQVTATLFNVAMKLMD
ncbi:hypothetical protein EPYR_01570 [Erwinia pyrifoliae DSM 12163]|nr:hypothetical protein EPYR_01570 [Erwinia pyrifoliae DSM 12163]